MEQNTRRQEIIQENFFSYLKLKGITMSAYAHANDLDRTLLSKWKSGVSNMSPEHIYQAASYFSISVNDLYYTKKELLRISAVENKFEPQIPQKIKLFLNYKPFFKKPFVLIALLLIIAVTLTFIADILKLRSEYFMVLVLSTMIISVFIVMRYLRKKEQFIINYTDDIYYQAKLEEPVSVKMHIYSRITMFILMIMLLVFNLLSLSQLDESLFQIIGLYIVILMFYMMVLIVSIVHLPFRFKTIRYDNQLEGYDLSFLLISLGSFQLVYFLFTLLINTINIATLILSCILYIINIIDFINISKYYNKYDIIFDAYGNPPQKLYKDK
jgi:transcriptional regulator with XRE-family HTH domain